MISTERGDWVGVCSLNAGVGCVSGLYVDPVY